MRAIAKALISAAAYIELKGDGEVLSHDDDVAALETMAYFLRDSTEEEKRTLKEAVDDLIQEERQSTRPNQRLIEFYSGFFENIVGDE